MNFVIDIVKILLSGILGFIFGIATEKIRFKHRMEAERRKRIEPAIEEIYPIIEYLLSDIEYCLNQQSRSNPDQETKEKTIEKVKQNLREYNEWYNKSGQKIELPLSYTDETLLGYLKGMLQYSNQISDPDFCSIKELEEMKIIFEKCKNRIKALEK